jgi:hypothetical protein
MSCKANERAGFAAPRPQIVDCAEAHWFELKAQRSQARAQDLLATGVGGSD